MTTRTRTFRDANAARLQKQNGTCEGCAYLRQLRPMCMSETSPNYRMVRDSYQDRCPSYAVPGKIHKPQTEQQTGTRP